MATIEKEKALDVVRQMVADGQVSQEVAEKYFPELKESENERIRKAIIESFELQDDNTTYSFVPKKDILAWLEKQGEQKLYVNDNAKEMFIKALERVEEQKLLCGCTCWGGARR